MSLGSDIHINHRAALGGGAVLGLRGVGLGGFLLRGRVAAAGVSGNGRNGADGAAGLGILRHCAAARRIAEAGDRRGAVAAEGLRAVGLDADVHAQNLIRFGCRGEGGARA